MPSPLQGEGGACEERRAKDLISYQAAGELEQRFGIFTPRLSEKGNT